jgi:hypothetical protein
MKRSELKIIIRECIKEILFDEGILSNLVSEIATGLSSTQKEVISESRSRDSVSLQEKERKEEVKSESKRRRLLETKRKMLDAMGSDSMKGVFEGTTPLPSPNTGSPHSPLADHDPGDAGIDITNLFKLAGKKWNDLK